MSVDRDEVGRIARLARLDLEDDETARLTEEMNRILEYAERLRSAGVDRAEMDHTDDSPRAADSGSPDQHGAIQGARLGTGEPDALRADLSAFAPAWDEGFFVVPPPPGVKADDDA